MTVFNTQKLHSYQIEEQMENIAAVLEDPNISPNEKVKELAPVIFQNFELIAEQNCTISDLSNKTFRLEEENENLSKRIDEKEKEIDSLKKKSKDIRQNARYYTLKGKAQALIEYKEMQNNVASIGISILDRVFSIGIISIIGIPIAFMTGSGHRVLQENTTDLNSSIWALKHFPESIEDDEILCRAKEIGKRHYFAKLREEYRSKKSQKESIPSLGLSCYISYHGVLPDGKGNYVPMWNIDNLSKEVLDEVEAIEKINLKQQKDKLREFVNNKFYQS